MLMFPLTVKLYEKFPRFKFLFNKICNLFLTPALWDQKNETLNYNYKANKQFLDVLCNQPQL